MILAVLSVVYAQNDGRYRPQNEGRYQPTPRPSIYSNLPSIFSNQLRPGQYRPDPGRYRPDNTGRYSNNDGKYRPSDDGKYRPDNSGNLLKFNFENIIINETLFFQENIMVPMANIVPMIQVIFLNLISRTLF